MTTSAVQLAIEDLRTALHDSLVALEFARAGIGAMWLEFSKMPRSHDNPDPQIGIGKGTPGDPSATLLGVWRRSTLVANLATDGPVNPRLTQQWIVPFYT